MEVGACAKAPAAPAARMQRTASALLWRFERKGLVPVIVSRYIGTRRIAGIHDSFHLGMVLKADTHRGKLARAVRQLRALRIESAHRGDGSHGPLLAADA